MTAGAVRDNRGRFVNGHPGGPGRPRGTDFRALVQRHRGDTHEQTLLNVYDALAKSAVSGDVQAAKLLLSALCDTDPQRIEVSRSIEDILACSWVEPS